MAVALKLPDLGEGITEGDIVNILVNKGDSIVVDQVLVEIETHKATVEFPSEYSGVVQDISVRVGDTVPIGTVLLTIQETNQKKTDEKTPSVASQEDDQESRELASPSPVYKQQAVATPPDRSLPIPASPSLRRRARVLQIDLYQVRGTGRGGRITHEDFDRFLLNYNVATNTSVLAPPLPDFSKWGAIDTKPYKSLRKKTAEHVTMSSQLLPHVTQFDEADVTDLEKLRKEMGVAIKAKGGKLTPMAFLLKAVAHCLQEFPQFATSLDEKAGEIVYKKYCHIGIAVDTPKGLMVPVMRDVNQKSLEDISIELVGIGQRARDCQVKIDELQGGVFTISSLGHLGGGHFTPIINYPEVAILGVSSHKHKVVVRDGEMLVRLMLPYAVSYDHRVIDGVAGVMFTRRMAEYLQSDALLENA